MNVLLADLMNPFKQALLELHYKGIVHRRLLGSFGSNHKAVEQPQTQKSV